MGNMGIETPEYPLIEPPVSLTSDTSRNRNCSAFSFRSKDEETLKRGNLLGTMRPFWLKTVESEERLRWIKLMIRKTLLVRDLEVFAQTTSEKLRLEESVMREEEREVLIGLMVVKRNDER